MQKKLIRVIILIIVAIFAVAGYFGFRIIESTVTETPESPFNIPHKGGNGPVACTQEAKQCPDGSYVSRSGPNCEFAACPEAIDTNGWQTFINSDGKYSFKYPSEWNAAVNKYNSKNSLFGPDASQESGLGGAEVNEYSGTLDEFIVYMQNSADIRYSSVQSITIDGTDGKKVEYSGSASRGSAVLLKSDNEILNIYIASQDSHILKIFNSLVSSFKLLNSKTADDSTFCQTNNDCACGVRIGTRECFVGNKNYVNTFGQCPDFCTGIDGKLTTKCVNNYCILAR
jgi:hypothetical protein